MSVEKTFYLGVGLFLIDSQKTWERTDGKRCPSNTCENVSICRGKFCPACGSKLVKNKVTVKYHYYNACEEENLFNEDDFFVLDTDHHDIKDTEILISNFTDKYSFSTENQNYIQLKPEMIEVEVNKFLNDYFDHIKILKEYYREIEVKFIGIEYYH